MVWPLSPAMTIHDGHGRHWMWQRTTLSAMLACTTASSQPATLRGFFDGPLPRSQTETCWNFLSPRGGKVAAGEVFVSLWWPGWAEQSHGAMASLSIRACAIHSTWAWCSRSLARCPWSCDSAKIVGPNRPWLFASIINVILCHQLQSIVIIDYAIIIFNSQCQLSSIIISYDHTPVPTYHSIPGSCSLKLGDYPFLASIQFLFHPGTESSYRWACRN